MARFGQWLPPLPDDVPVFAAVDGGEGRPRRPGLRVTRHPLAPPSEELHGVRVALPAEVLLACAVNCRDDRRRDRRLTERGWVRNGYTAPDVLTRVVAVLRDADRVLGREHRPERVRWGLVVPPSAPDGDRSEASGHRRRARGLDPGRS